MKYSHKSLHQSFGLPVMAITIILLAFFIFNPTMATENVLPDQGIFINEIRIDQGGTDNDEYFELFGDPDTSLDGLTYLVIGDGSGGSGVIEAVVDLSSQKISGDGFFVAAEGTFTLGIADFTTNLNFENSDNVTHLLVNGFSGSDGDDLDTNDDGILDITPWITELDRIALVEEENPPSGTEYHYGPPSIGPDGSFVPGHAFVCTGEWVIGEFNLGIDDTPGGDNACEPPLPNVVINEIRIDQGGSDNDEYFELVGDADVSLDGLTYLVIGDGSGGSGVIEAVVDLSGNTMPGDGFFVVAEDTFSLGNTDFITDINFENSDNVTHLLVNGFTGADGDDLDTNDDGILDITPWSDELDRIALVEEENPPGSTEYHYGPPSIGPDGSFVPGHAFICFSEWTIGEFTLGIDDTPGLANVCVPPPPNVLISEIRIDQSGSDNDEYFELVGDADVSLDGLTYLVIGDGAVESGSGVVEAVVDLGGNTMPGDGFFVVAEDTFSLGNTDFITDINFENSDNVTHLLVNGFTGADGDDLDTNDDGILDITPWSDELDRIALVEEENPPGSTEYHYGPPSVGPDGSFVPGHAFVCDTEWLIGEFTLGVDDTPGEGNDCPVELPNVLINEIRTDQSSSDNDEYFELLGDPGASLDGLTYLVIGDGSGGSGTIEAVVDLSSNSIPGDGFFVAAESTFSLAIADLTTNINFENSDNVTHFLVYGFSGSNGDDLDTDDNGTLDITPWSDELDRIALVEEENPPSGTEYHYGPPSIGPDGSFVPGHAYVCPAGWVIGEFDLGVDDTPGAANDCLPDVHINEIRIDQSGSDNDEYFELLGEPGASLEGLTYLVIGDGSGGSGVIEAVVDLSGNTIPDDGFFVVAEDTFTLGVADLIANINFENSDNVTHLLVYGFSGLNGDDLDTNDDGVLDLTPWSDELDRIALVEEENPPGSTEFHYGPPSIGPDGSFVPGHVGYCQAKGWTIREFGLGIDDTPGGPNICTSCGEDLTMINEIQGSGDSSPYVGQIHHIEGVVVGVFQDNSDELGGFFVQEEDDQVDGDPNSSEGIFVHDDGFGFDVSLGDIAHVTGEVNENFGQTELSNISLILLCGTGASVTPMTVTLPISDLANWEHYEGMSVNVAQELHVTEVYNLGRYGEVSLSIGDRLYNPTNVTTPGASANALQDLNDRSRVLLDDGSMVQNPDPIIYPSPGLSALNTLRVGDTLPGLTGPLFYAFGAYRIEPVGEIPFIPSNPRTITPDVGKGSLSLASFNVLNYFTTIDTGALICGPTGDQGCRGADSETEFQRQRDKIITAMLSIEADVFGLMEIENNGYGAGSAIQDLVDGLNSAAPVGVTYDLIDPGIAYLGGDVIAVGLIYRTETVAPVGAAATTNVYPFDELNRQPLAQTFEEIATGERVTVIVNHLKSKSCSGSSGDDADQGDGQSCWNFRRTEAAEFLANWSDPTGTGEAHILIMGDLNSYAMEDPITALEGAGFTDMLESFVGGEAYTYVFYGQSGSLDYAMANASLAPYVKSATAWHINPDEPLVLDYNEEYQTPGQVISLYNDDAYRASDHDPVIVRLLLPPIIDNFTSIAREDGIILENNETSGRGGKVFRGHNYLRAGDDRLDKQNVSILSFNTSSLPEDAIIVGAVLKLNQRSTSGTPYDDLGTLWVDVRRGTFGRNSRLRRHDFGAPAHLYGNDIGFSVTPAVRGIWVQAVMPDDALGSINKAGRTQFRLRFDLDDDDDNSFDYVDFTSGDADNLDRRPTLIIIYTLP